MLVVKDAMVLIHLSKLTLLKKSCEFIGEVLIPKLVYKETVETGKEAKRADAVLIREVVESELIKVKEVGDKELIKRAEEFNIQSGEAEAVALYWEVNADLLATDDDNVRSKKEVLDLRLIGTPVLILKLYGEGEIGEEKFKGSLDRLREIGWFSNAVIDKVIERGEKYG